MAIEADYAFSGALQHKLAANLGRFARRAATDTTLRKAAVAIVVAPESMPGAGEPRATVLLTRRPAHLRRHANQFALPGGRLDPGETDIAAALRETREELGLTLTADDVLGLLDDYPTRSGFRMTPVVVWARSIAGLAPDPEEVARVFQIPLRELDRPEIPHLHPTTGDEHPVLSAPLPTIGHHLYAPTAAILYQFREVAMRGLATRVAHFDQPRFAWQ